MSLTETLMNVLRDAWVLKVHVTTNDIAVATELPGPLVRERLALMQDDYRCELMPFRKDGAMVATCARFTQEGPQAEARYAVAAAARERFELSAEDAAAAVALVAAERDPGFLD